MIVIVISAAVIILILVIAIAILLKSRKNNKFIIEYVSDLDIFLTTYKLKDKITINS